VNPNIAVWNEVNDLFPSQYVAILQQVEQVLCQQSVIPAVNSVVAGEETRAVGVTDLVQACLQLIGQSEIMSMLSTSNPSTVFDLALGNIFACNKIANSVLASSTLSEGGSVLCNAIEASVPG
jgi:hypothetical protein